MEKGKVVKRIIISGLIYFLLSLTVCAEGVITLEEALKLGLENNTGIRESQIEVKKAEIDLDSSRKAFYPEISLSTSFTRIFLDDNGVQGIGIESPSLSAMQPSKNNYQTVISIQQPIYLGGKLRLSSKQAEKGLEISEIQYMQKKNELLFNIIQSYYGVLLSEERVKIEEEALELIKEHKRVARVSFNAGLSLKTDLLQVEIEESKAIHSLESARNDLVIARKMLGNMIGIELNKGGIAQPVLELKPELDIDVQHQLAKNNRAELRFIDINKDLLELNIQMEENKHLPNIVLVGNYQWQETELTFDDGTGSISLSLSMNIFDKGLSKNSENKLNKELEKLAISKSNLEELIKIEIEALLLTIKENRHHMELQAMNLEKAIENLQLENKRYQAGIGTNMDVMNAQIMLKQTKIANMQANYQYQISIFQLMEKTGRLIDFYQEVINNEE